MKVGLCEATTSEFKTLVVPSSLADDINLLGLQRQWAWFTETKQKINEKRVSLKFPRKGTYNEWHKALFS